MPERIRRLLRYHWPMSRAVASLLVVVVLAFGPLLRVLCDERCIVSVMDIVEGPPTPQAPCHNADPSESAPAHRPFAPRSSDCAHPRQIGARAADSMFKIAIPSTDVSSAGCLVGVASAVVFDVTASRRLASPGRCVGLPSPVVAFPLRI